MKQPGNNKSIKRHRDDLTGEHRFGDTGQLIIAALFLIIWVTDSFILKYTTFLNKHIPLVLQITMGAIILIIALILARYGMKIVFNKVREKPGVIRDGVFRVVRHPIYLSEMLFYLSLLVFRTSLAAVAIWIVAILFLHYLSQYEEKLLIERFGDDYRQYMKDVPMYFPRIMGRKRKRPTKKGIICYVNHFIRGV